MHLSHAALERMRAFDVLPQTRAHFTLSHYLCNQTTLSVSAAAAVLATAEAGGKIVLPPPFSSSSYLRGYASLLKAAYGTRIDTSAADAAPASVASTPNQQPE